MERIDRRRLLKLSMGAALVGAGAGVLPLGIAEAAGTGGFPPVPGMLGDRRANEMWFQFDQATRFAPSPDVLDIFDAIQAHIGGPLVQTFRDVWLEMSASPEYPGNFIEFVTPIKDQLQALSDLQLGSFDRFYRPDSIEFVQAFAFFGQGVLFDPRRTEVAAEVHTMDRVPPIGYHGWHSYLRAMMVLGISPARWGRIDAVIAFSWALQSIAKPQMREPNPALPAETVLKQAAHWLTRSSQQLDQDFRSIPFPVGIS